MPRFHRGSRVVLRALAVSVTLLTACEAGAPEATAPTPVATVAISSSESTILVGQTLQLSATVRDAQGATLVGRSVAWSTSEESRATVSPTGLVTARAAGSVTISATSEGRTGTLTLTVTPPPVATVTVTAPTTSFAVGSTLQLTASLRDVGGNALVGRAVTWTSSDTTRAVVSAAGLVSARAAGSFQVTATSEGKSGSLSLSASNDFVGSVTVTASASSLLVATTVQATAVVRTVGGAIVTDRPVAWTTGDATTATVTQAGSVRGELPGSVTITATAEGKSGSVTLQVTAPALSVIQSGLTGHIGVDLNERPLRATHAWGFSYYTMISPLQTVTTRNTQLGWGVWISPENDGFSQPLCPVGTYARDNWPERGPTYSSVYQTMEGGAGLWTTTRFPSTLSKFRINSTPDCYNYQVASTGWHFYGSLLPENKLGLAQLSNRLLTVPDGVVMAPSQPGLLGYGWIALPLIPGGTSALGVATGNQSWTLFFHAQNFRGPVAFFTPEMWSAVNATDATGVGRGLDARPAIAPGVALEIGNAPMFENSDRNGVKYRRIPRLSFPTEGNRSTLIQDVRFYSRSAIWDAVSAWSAGAPAPTQFAASGAATPAYAPPFSQLRMPDGSITFQSTTFYSASFTTQGGSSAMGMQWGGGFETGVIPEYYRLDGSTWRPVLPADVPRETYLAQQTFAPLSRSTFPNQNVNSGAWTSSGWAAGPFTVTLSDGSIVDYVWYRFIDQPAIARLNLDAATRSRLQALAEALHARGPTDGLSLAPPTSGPLVALDPAQLVTPPAGLERGYVPILIRQR